MQALNGQVVAKQAGSPPSSDCNFASVCSSGPNDHFVEDFLHGQGDDDFVAAFEK
jgi:hypothetical protein